METKFTQFLRTGGNSEFCIRRKADVWVGGRTAFSTKSEFPNYSALRDSFAAKLDAATQSNTTMLLHTVGAQYGPPLTAAELPDVSGARAETLAEWERRIDAIWSEWQSHLQRLRPVREVMEQHLLRGFSGLINEQRQRDLGVRQYVWRSREDEKVRPVHAAYDGQVFNWNAPPIDGHPGQAYNCRCVAEPVPSNAPSNIVLADFVLPADGIASGNGLGSRLADGLIARTPAGLAFYAALEASNALQGFTEAASQEQVREAATILGADLGTVEGRLAAITYAGAKEAASTGGLVGVPKEGPGAEIFAQGMALYAMYDPEAFMTIEGFQAAVKRIATDTLQAWADGRLRLQEGSLAAGWAEVFPELTDDEKKLGQLPGFTPERLDQFREEYPAGVLGLPTHTGHGPVEDPTGNVISTPIPEVGQPNIVTIDRSPEELDALASDPAHGGRIDGKTMREREVGLGAEARGLVSGPIRRDPTGAAEFIDSDGQAWDVKGFRSDFPPKSGGFDLARDLGKVERELAAGHNVIIDTEKLDERDLGELKLEVERRGLGDRVVYWP